MSHPRVFLASGITALLAAASSFGHAEVSAANDYNLNSEVQALLLDKSYPGECYSKITFPSVRKQKVVIISPVPKLKEAQKWARVICETDVTPHFLYWLEVRLSHIGILDTQDIFTEGVRVGLNDRLYKAIETFQLSQGLAVSGLSYETINILSRLDISSEPETLDEH